jgi:predicted Ser/Thr protein kinase
LELKDRLANGTFGFVFSGICKKRLVAIKIANAKEYEKDLFHEVTN